MAIGDNLYFSLSGKIWYPVSTRSSQDKRVSTWRSTRSPADQIGLYGLPKVQNTRLVPLPLFLPWKPCPHIVACSATQTCRETCPEVRTKIGERMTVPHHCALLKRIACAI